MNKYFKYILVIAIIIIAIVLIYNYSSPSTAQEDILKKQEIDNTFAIWLNIAGSGDIQTLTQNEASIKKDLYDKLVSGEVISLKQYSIAIQDLLSVKNKPFNPLFLTSISYLTSNFSDVKKIISKTNAKNIFSNFMNLVPKSNSSAGTTTTI